MSSGITLSGFNNIDFGSIVTALMTQASIPLTRLQSRQSDINSQVANYKKLSAQLSAVQTAATALSTPTGIAGFAATSSNSGAVSVAAGTKAVAGHYDVVVNSLAHAQVTASASAAPDADTTIVATGGTLTIGGKVVTLTGGVTLQQLATAINETADVPATATVIQSGPNAFRLVLTANSSGAANGFTIQNGLTGTTVAFTDTNGDGTSGDSAADNAVSAADASLLVNNIAITSASNTISTAIPGSTLTLVRQDPLTTVAIDVTPDSSALQQKLASFVTAYNNLVGFVTTQISAVGSQDHTTIGRDTVVRQIRNTLKSSLTASYTNSGAYDNVSQIGLEFTQTGTLQLNTASLNSATANGLGDISKLFSSTGGGSGAFATVSNLLKEYTQSNGLVDTTQQRLSAQASRMGQQIIDMQQRLAMQKRILQDQFSAADSLMSKLNSQSSSLASLSSNSA